MVAHTAKNFAEVFLQFEPIRKGTKDKEEYSKAEQKQSAYNAGCIPYVTRIW